ncbi:MAG TPA: heme biosynthesis HemY N-terminal domain-containing protein [Alphaproteobacteria bacterium]|jgi:HemY protein
MIRVLAYVLMVVAAVAVAGWFALRPGLVAIEWLGWHVEAPVGLVVVAVLLAVALLIALWRFWSYIFGAPKRMRHWRQMRRREAGHAELTRGMIAVASGDAEAARLAARRAQDLAGKDEAALALLLAAQAAQLAGDEVEAERSFTAMLARPDTEFIGLRGLLAQANRGGDRQQALALARRAYALKPDAPWLLTTMFDLSLREGDWRTAEEVVTRGERRQLFAPARAQRHAALLAHLQAEAAERAGDLQGALRQARKAYRLLPDSAPLAIQLVRLLIADGARREAVKTIEAAWPLAPHAELARLYLEARYEPDPLKAFGRMERLVKLAPTHLESRLALARAAIAAKLWGTARGQLVAATAEANDPPARAWRLLAELEQLEHNDEGAARRALDHAAHARPDEAWTCRSCNARTAAWSAVCGACDSFDSLDWTSPPSVVALTMDQALPDELPKPANA